MAPISTVPGAVCFLYAGSVKAHQLKRILDITFWYEYSITMQITILSMKFQAWFMGKTFS